MRKVDTGTQTYVLSSGFLAKTTGAWVNLTAAYTRFGARCVRGSSVGTSNFNVVIQGNLSTVNSTGAAVGAIGAYVPQTLLTLTQAAPGPGKIKFSTSLIPVQYVRFSCTAYTTAANRRLRIEFVALP